ncbi:MAG TPA: hypothetical protein VHZ50_06595 [Puia sp.]|nr:hypothetical protein [Puia sp.]
MKTDIGVEGLEYNMEKHPEIIKTNEGYIRYYGKVYVPKSERERIIKEAYNTIGNGHPGFKKLHEKLRKQYYMPKMRHEIKEIIKKCTECQMNKPVRHALYGEMDIMDYPKQAWNTVTMDWIVKLPLSKEPMTGVTYDSIWVVTDQLTKYVHFVPYKESSTAEDLAYWFMRTIVANHGLPRNIISDRDKLFKSNFWNIIVKELGMKHKQSTAYHPQTNGQTERTNQTLEQYLRFYLNYDQDNWVKLLLIV